MYRPPRDPSVPRASWVYRICAAIAFGIMRLQRWRFDVRGTEHLPATGGAVIAATHNSFFDFFTVGKHGYEEMGRPVRIMAKESLFRAPVFGWLMDRAEHIPVHRGAGRDALASAVDALQRGELVLVLPEQTISPALELQAFKTGAARMAAAAGVPLIPAASWGSHRFATTGHRPRWRWKLPVSIRYGAPLHPTPEDDPTEVTARLRDVVGDLLEQAMDSYPDGTPARAWWVPARRGGSAPTVAEAQGFLDELSRDWTRPGGHAPEERESA